MGRIGRTPICVESLKADAIEFPQITALLLILSFRVNILVLHNGQKTASVILGLPKEAL